MSGDLETRYELTSRLGSGPTGTVWKAWSRATGEVVAIKVLHPHLAADPHTVERFAKERTTLTAFVHPALPRVHEVVAQDNVVALVRDLVPGADLRNPQDQDPPISARHAVILAVQVAEALAVSHQSGVVHGGLKPANLIVSRARVWLTDCRVAALALAPPDAAAGGGYVAPECVGGELPGPAADIYALGSVLRDTLALCPRDETPELPRALQDLIVACLDPNPAARPQTAAVAACLRSIRDEYSLSAAAAAPPPKAESDLAAPDPPPASDAEDEHPEPETSVVTTSERRQSRNDPGTASAHARPRTPAKPPKPAPKARRARASHVRTPPAHPFGPLRRRPVMVGVISAALLSACVLGLVARNVALRGGGDESAPSGQPTDGRSQAPAPLSPRATLSSSAAPRSGPGDQSLASATRFVHDWFGALNQAVSSGNTSQLDALSAEGCAGCARARQVVQEAYRDGGTLRGGLYEVRAVRANSFWSPSHRVLQIVFDRSPRSSLSAAATVRSTLAGATFATCQLVLTEEPQGWRVREVLAGTSIA